jgi:hypothetical protein
VLTSERRVGKTCILHKMEENPKEGWLPLLYLVEGKKHPIEFVEGLYDIALKKKLVKGKLHRLKKLYIQYAGGEQIGSWKLPQIRDNWKALLESLIADLSCIEKKVLVMIDELPLMLSKIIKLKDVGPLVGMDFLDTLRELRNKYEHSRKILFIYSGSIGIHLVIRDLKRNYGYTSDPVNNMKIVSLTGMDESGAKLLCDKLGEDNDFEFDDKDSLIAYICKRTDNLPFYIQHVFDYFYERNKKNINKKTVDEVINYLVNDPKDVGFFRHYIDRIKTYYDQIDQDITLFILGRACKMSDYWLEDDIIELARDHVDVDEEKVKETLDLIWNDHYLVRKVVDHKRYYKFKYNILKEWWLVNRG